MGKPSLTVQSSTISWAGILDLSKRRKFTDYSNSMCPSKLWLQCNHLLKVLLTCLSKDNPTIPWNCEIKSTLSSFKMPLSEYFIIITGNDQDKERERMAKDWQNTLFQSAPSYLFPLTRCQLLQFKPPLTHSSGMNLSTD